MMYDWRFLVVVYDWKTITFHNFKLFPRFCKLQNITKLQDFQKIIRHPFFAPYCSIIHQIIVTNLLLLSICTILQFFCLFNEYTHKNDENWYFPQNSLFLGNYGNNFFFNKNFKVLGAIKNDITMWKLLWRSISSIFYVRSK